MRKTLSGLIVFGLLLVPTQLLNAATVKAGASCVKLGQNQIVNGYKYTCIKSGKKLVWNKGTAIPKASTLPTPTPSSTERLNPTPTPTATPTISPNSTPSPSPSPTNNPLTTDFQHFCDSDPLAPQEWVKVQQWSLEYAYCARPYRYVAAASPIDTMKTALTSFTSLPIAQCKLDDPAGRPWNWQNFANPHHAYRPTKSAIVQVIPLQFSDATSNANPQTDYQKYFDFYKSFLVNSSDVPIRPEYRVPDHYIQLGFSVSKYPLNDEHANESEFLSQVSQKVGAEIKVSDADQILFVVPTDIPANKVVQSMNFGNPDSTIFAGKSIYMQGSSDLGASYLRSWTPDPWLTIHESIGHQMGLDDHGAAELFRPEQTVPVEQKDLGTGQWGNMSGVTGDFLVWDKWTVGWVYDSQISCVDRNTKATIAVTPSTNKSEKTKAIVIPLTASKGIVIESERSTGYNYKLPKATNGALVYVVEMKEVAHGGGMPWGYGVYVQRPENRPKEIFQHGMALGDATLKSGETITVEGVKITVIEAGDFGDVIQIG